MKRLTTPEGECVALNSYGIECVCTPDENCDEGCLNQRIARLAQYENTGLTPEQIRQALQLLRLAVDDFEQVMDVDKCVACSTEYCTHDALCRWRGADEAEELLGGENDE